MNKQKLVKFEDEMAQLFNAGKIMAPIHLYHGNEDKIINIFKKIPFLRTVYSAIGQMTQSFAQNRKSKKKSVVLVEYPRKGSWAVGFATQENTGEIASKTNKDLVNVFVPTTPNPTSGFLLMFPKDEIIYLDMSFEDASKFIVSAGTSNPKK